MKKTLILAALALAGTGYSGAQTTTAYTQGDVVGSVADLTSGKYFLIAMSKGNEKLLKYADADQCVAFSDLTSIPSSGITDAGYVWDVTVTPGSDGADPTFTVKSAANEYYWSVKGKDGDNDYPARHNIYRTNASGSPYAVGSYKLVELAETYDGTYANAGAHFNFQLTNAQFKNNAVIAYPFCHSNGDGLDQKIGYWANQGSPFNGSCVSFLLAKAVANKTTTIADVTIFGAPQSRTGWVVTGCGQRGTTGDSDGGFAQLFDDNVNTYWHSQWGADLGQNHFFIIDRGENVTEPIAGFGYTPRQGVATGNGYVTDYSIYVLNDIEGLTYCEADNLNGFASDSHTNLATFLTNKTPAKTGHWDIRYNDQSTHHEYQEAFATPQTGRYVLFVANHTDGAQGDRYANCAEFNLYSDAVTVPAGLVFRAKFRPDVTAGGNYNSYWKLDGQNGKTRISEDADAFVPERLWYFMDAGAGKVSIHSLVYGDARGLEFTTTTNVAGVFGTNPTALTVKYNAITDNSNSDVTNFTLQISDAAYVNDAQNYIGVWNNGNASTDNGSTIALFFLEDTDIDAVAGATGDVKAAAKENPTPENVANLFSAQLKSQFLSELEPLVAAGIAARDNLIKDNTPGCYNRDLTMITDFLSALEYAEPLVAEGADPTLEQLQTALANLRVPTTNTSLAVANGIYKISNGSNDNRGYLYDNLNANNYVWTSGKSQRGTDIPEANEHWAVININGYYHIYNVGSKRFLVAPTTDGNPNAGWTLSADEASEITLVAANSVFALGRLEIRSGNIHMSISNNYDSPLGSYYAANDGGVPFIFERVGDLDTDVHTEMANRFFNKILESGKVYTITNTDAANDRGSLLYDGTHNVIYTTNKGGVALDATNPNHQWSFVTVDGKHYLYNLGAQKFANAYYHKRDEWGSTEWSWQLSETGTPVSLLYFAERDMVKFRIMGGENAASGNDAAGMMIINGNAAPVPNCSKDQDGNGFTFAEVEGVTVDTEAAKAMMAAANAEADNYKASAKALVENWDEATSTLVVGQFNTEAVSQFLRDMAYADAEGADASKVHGVVSSALSYVYNTERIGLTNEGVYTVELVGENGNTLVYPAEIDTEAGNVDPNHANWLCTIGENGAASFTHVFIEPGETQGVALFAAGDRTTSTLAIEDVTEFKVANTQTPGIVNLTDAEGNNVGNSSYIITQKPGASSETTEIDEITAEGNRGAEVIYDLQGRRVNKAAKGVYIVNGKKMLVK